MLQITVPPIEQWDEENQQFVYARGQILQLEHSLVSLSKWESKWHKPFISKQKTSPEEMLDYIKFMTLTKNVDPEIYDRLTPSNLDEIKNYIDNPMTATTFSQVKTTGVNREIVTAELIYYWMIALNIPFECQKWHLNRLITLIRVCNIKNQPPKRKSRRELMRRNAALNAARRKQMNTRG